MASLNVASIPAAHQPVGNARATVAIGVITAFLALEPLLRSLAMWRVPSASLRQVLHADPVWLLIAVIGLLAASTLGEVRELARRHMWLVGLLLLWCVVAALSSIFAQVPSLAAIRSLRWALGLAFALVLLVTLRRQPRAAQTILIGWCVGFCAYAGVLLIFVLTDPIREGIDWGRALPGVKNVRHLGFEAMAVALLASLFRPVGAGGLTLWLPRVAAIVGWAVLFWSGGRGSFLAACAALGCVMLLCGWRSARWGEAALLAAVGFTLATAHTPPGGSFGARRTIGLDTVAQGVAETQAVNQVTSGRWAIWQESLAIIAANPWLGIGEAHTPLHVTAARTYEQPHNLFLQATLAWGILGGAIFLFAIVDVLRRAARHVRAASIESPAVAGFTVMLAMAINSMLDGTLFHPRPVTYFLIGSCLALGAVTVRRPVAPAWPDGLSPRRLRLQLDLREAADVSAAPCCDGAIEDVVC